MILPLYLIRKYDSLFQEREYKCIRTARSWYVLDYNSSNITSYADRRMKLLTEPLPYKLYPINTVINTLEELLTVKYSSNTFYTDKGKLFKWSKKSFYKMKDHLVRSSWITDTGHTVVDIKDYGLAKVKSYNGEQFAKIVTVNKQQLLYGFSEEKNTPPYRIKI